jgi:16S rRNA (cytidine1402-2'-O)-methyltransferase
VPLYVIATPIGNLEDVTLRCLDALRRADVVACEDTRVTKRLLDRHGIVAPLTPFHEHNEQRRADELADRAAAGETVAVVTNAGTPSVSDPGFRLVRACVDRGVAVVPLPGASAAVTALVASGLPTHRYTFLGFPPRKSGARTRLFASVAAFDGSLVVYESPLRLAGTLRDAHAALGDRRGCLARELTKLHEEFVRGTLSQLAARYESQPPRGECTLVIEGVTRQTGAREEDEPPAGGDEAAGPDPD